MRLFIHIPKTAGTSLRQLLAEKLPDRIAYDYGPNHELTHEVIREPDLSPLEKRQVLERSGYAILYGHVSYPDWREAFAPGEVCAILRHPVDRCISHYQHYLSRGGDPADRLAEKVVSGELSLPQFARIDRQRDFQSRQLGIAREGLEQLADYGSLLLSESLEQTLGLRLRLNSGQRSFLVTPEDIAAIIEANPLDLLVYELLRQAGREGFWCWPVPEELRRSPILAWLGRS